MIAARRAHGKISANTQWNTHACIASINTGLPSVQLRPRIRPQLPPQPGDSWRKKNARAADLAAPDHLPTCPRCGDYCEVTWERCQACGSRIYAA